MDTDDISRSERFETQIAFLKANPEVDVLGTWIAEINNDMTKISSYRKLPCEHKNIIRFAKKRSPMNHMTVMFSKSAVVNVGCYDHFRIAQDYHLWVRMIQKGACFANLPKVLVFAAVPIQPRQTKGAELAMRKLNTHCKENFCKSVFLAIGNFSEISLCVSC